ncbi:MAG: hypothetical protein JRJ75_15255 [Deltaproteobacteria bacterium]|nr:hypothetical protein [Deltaproteobacteria bacterium]
MLQLNFTTRVLGPIAAYRLEQHKVTQTLRGYTSSAAQAALTGQLKVGDQMKVLLDGRPIGFAEYVKMDAPRWIDIDTADAQRGGFDDLANLEKALQKAGYRFRPIDMYRLYRIQFSWLEEVKDD